MHQFSKRKPCYYCGAPPPSSREHAPPQMMFDGFDCDSITVPACERHNTEKSMGDRAVVSAAIHCALLTKRDHPDSALLTENVLRAIDRVEPKLQKAAGHVAIRRIRGAPPHLDVPLPHVLPEVDIRRWMRHLTAAVTWRAIGPHHQHVNWDDAVSWSPGFVPSDDGSIEFGPFALRIAQGRLIEEELSVLSWRAGWSAAPRPYPSDIYSFSVAFIKPDSWAGNNVALRHRVYGGSIEWYVLSSFSGKGRNALRTVVAQEGTTMANPPMQPTGSARG